MMRPCFAVLLCLCLTAAIARADDPDSWTILFDGASTSAWHTLGKQSFPTKGWTVQDGCLHLDKAAKAGDLATNDTYKDFELVFEWKVAPGSNSGLKYRVQEKPGNTFAFGPEYQIIDDEKHADALKSPKRITASLYELFAPSGARPKPAGQFNQSRIVARGNHIEHWLNGVKVVECEFGSDAWNQAQAASKFKGNKQYAQPIAGHIALQDHGDEVWFRNIKIRPLH